MERRTLLKWATAGLSGLFGALLGVPAIAYLTDARKRQAADQDYKTVARFSELRVDEPTQVVIRDMRTDAWTLHPDEVVGRVWLVRRQGDQVDAFTTICPHLGCSINFEEKAKRFLCPCHNGTFALSGERVDEKELGAANPVPRGMDKLEIRRDPTNPDLIQVKYQNFMQGRHDKVAKV